MGSILLGIGSPLIKLILLPLIVSHLTDVYKEVHPPAWLAPYMPYILGLFGTVAVGTTTGDPTTNNIGTVLTGLLTGAVAVGYYDLKTVLMGIWDKWVLKKEDPAPVPVSTVPTPDGLREVLTVLQTLLNKMPPVPPPAPSDATPTVAVNGQPLDLK